MGQTRGIAGRHSCGHALYQPSIYDSCRKGPEHSTIESGSEGDLKWEYILKENISFQKCSEGAKGGQHLIWNGCHLKWPK